MEPLKASVYAAQRFRESITRERRSIMSDKEKNSVELNDKQLEQVASGIQPHYTIYKKQAH